MTHPLIEFSQSIPPPLWLVLLAAAFHTAVAICTRPEKPARPGRPSHVSGEDYRTPRSDSRLAAPWPPTGASHRASSVTKTTSSARLERPVALPCAATMFAAPPFAFLVAAAHSRPLPLLAVMLSFAIFLCVAPTATRHQRDS